MALYRCALACGAGCNPLRDAARACILLHFPAVLRAGEEEGGAAESLGELSAREVYSLLRDSELQVCRL